MEQTPKCLQEIDILILKASKELFQLKKSGEDLIAKQSELETYKLIKAEYVKHIKSGIFFIDDSTSTKILLRMKKQYEDALAMYKSSNAANSPEALERIENEERQYHYLCVLIPAEPTEEDIKAEVEAICNSIGIVEMKHMKQIMSQVQTKWPSAPGKLISSYVRDYISSH